MARSVDSRDLRHTCDESGDHRLARRAPDLDFHTHTHLEPDLCALLSSAFKKVNLSESPFHQLKNGIITSTF